MILRAKWVLPLDGPPVANGAVAVAGDKITAVGPHADVRAAQAGEVRDLGEVVLLPGLINAHCHLEYSCMRDQVEWRGSFIEWLLQLRCGMDPHASRTTSRPTRRTRSFPTYAP